MAPIKSQLDTMKFYFAMVIFKQEKSVKVIISIPILMIKPHLVYSEYCSVSSYTPEEPTKNITVHIRIWHLSVPMKSSVLLLNLWFDTCREHFCLLLSGKTSYWLARSHEVRSREIGCYNDCLAIKYDTHFDSTVADVPVKFQSDWKSLNPNLTASRLRESLR